MDDLAYKEAEGDQGPRRARRQRYGLFDSSWVTASNLDSGFRPSRLLLKLCRLFNVHLT